MADACEAELIGQLLEAQADARNLQEAADQLRGQLRALSLERERGAHWPCL